MAMLTAIELSKQVKNYPHLKLLGEKFSKEVQNAYDTIHERH
jgi:hypothetical protein